MTGSVQQGVTTPHGATLASRGRVGWRWIRARGLPLDALLSTIEQSARACGIEPSSHGPGRLVHARRYDDGRCWVAVPVDSDALACSFFRSLLTQQIDDLALFTYRVQHDPDERGEVLRSYVVPHSDLAPEELPDQRPIDPMHCDIASEGPAGVYEAAEEQMVTWAPLRLGFAGTPIVESLEDRIWKVRSGVSLTTAEARRLHWISDSIRTCLRVRIDTNDRPGFHIVIDTSRARTINTVTLRELDILETSVLARIVGSQQQSPGQGDLAFLHALERLVTAVVRHVRPIPPTENSLGIVKASGHEDTVEVQDTSTSVTSDLDFNDAVIHDDVEQSSHVTIAPDDDVTGQTSQDVLVEFQVEDRTLVLTETELQRVKDRWAHVRCLRPESPTESQVLRFAQVLAEAPGDIWERCFELLCHLVRTDEFPPLRTLSGDRVATFLAGISRASAENRTQLIESAGANEPDLLLQALNRLLTT